MGLIWILNVMDTPRDANQLNVMTLKQSLLIKQSRLVIESQLKK